METTSAVTVSPSGAASVEASSSTGTTNKSCWQSPNRPYYIGFAVLAVVAIAVGLGVGLGLRHSNSSSPRHNLNIPPLQPPVAASVPGALRPSSATWNRPQQIPTPLMQLLNGFVDHRVKLQAVTSSSVINQIKDRVFGPGPTDFMYRLGMVDARIQELRTRNLQGDKGRACLAQPAQLWNPSFLPNISFPMWFSCQEVMDQGSASSGLSVYFGTRGDTSYVAELQWPTTGSNPRMAVLASVSNNGTQVQVWQVGVGTATTSSTSFFHIIADRTLGQVEISFASTEANSIDIGCGIRLRSSPSFIYSVGEYADPAQAGSTLCSGTPTSTLCANATTLAATPSLGDCASIQNFRVATLTNATLYSDQLVARAPAGIRSPSMPALTSFSVMQA